MDWNQINQKIEDFREYPYESDEQHVTENTIKFAHHLALLLNHSHIRLPSRLILGVNGGIIFTWYMMNLDIYTEIEVENDYSTLFYTDNEYECVSFKKSSQELVNMLPKVLRL
jgi:hypothetical protein